jgi:glycosyltransferase involved in cell wall biosynthesis
MRRIAVLLCTDTVGQDAGTERHVVELIARLDRTRFDLHLCCLEDSPRLREIAGHCAAELFPVVSVWRPNGLRQIRRLRRYIDEHGIDVVHTFVPKATIVGVLAAKGSRAGAVVTSRRNMGYWHTPFHLRLFRYLDHHTTRVLANSEGVRRLTIETECISPDRVDVLYNGVDLDRYARAAEPQQSAVVGIVANYRPVKNLGLFLRAARIVAAQAPEATFLLAGQGPLRGELGRLAGELGISGRVSFSDGKGEVADHLSRMCIGCLSSDSEGFSNAILEYMAAGLPVVARDVGGNAEAVEDGVTGCLVRDCTPDAFARPIVALLRDPVRRAEMGRRALERCRERFEIGAAVRRLEDYYAALVGRSDTPVCSSS